MAGALVAQPEWKIVKDEGAAISFDCGGGSGIVAVNTVYDEVLKRARKYGVAAGTGRHSANIGCGGYYGHRMAEDNVIGIVMSNTYPCQAPYLGADRLIGTNPIIMGAPTSNPERPIVIDISTSGVAIGKVQAYRRENKEMPEGSYTTSLFKSGVNKMAQKVGEEAVETVIEACNGTDDRLIYEGSDLLYHLIVLLTSKGYRIEDLARELIERHSATWHKH